jgi:hypothetical protein
MKALLKVLSLVGQWECNAMLAIDVKRRASATLSGLLSERHTLHSKYIELETHFDLRLF